MRQPVGLTYDSFKGSNSFPSLDGLRAIAVSLVLVVHYGGKQGSGLTGWLGVQVFFVLSGFLITTLLLRENDAKGSIDLRAFYVRRVFRIMPVYYAVLAFTVWQTWRLGGESWDQLKVALPYYLTFLNEQTAAAPWKQTWTLGIEWKFYLVWPLLAFFVARGAVSRIIISAITAVVLLKFWGVAWLQPYHYSVLLLGALLAILMHSPRGFRIFAPLTRPTVSAAIFIAFAVFQTQIFRLEPILGDAWLANVYGLAVMLLIPAILGPGIPRRLLASRPFVFVGQRSYSLYLIQIVASQSVTGFAPWRGLNFFYVAQVLIVGLIISDFLLRYLEKPCIAFGQRIAKRRHQSSPDSKAWIGPAH